LEVKIEIYSLNIYRLCASVRSNRVTTESLRITTLKDGWRHQIADVTGRIDPDIIDIYPRVSSGMLYSGAWGSQAVFTGRPDTVLV